MFNYFNNMWCLSRKSSELLLDLIEMVSQRGVFFLTKMAICKFDIISFKKMSIL